MTKPDVVYEVYQSEYADYRLSPNPNTEPGAGYKFGAVLEWRKKSESEWRFGFSIRPIALGPLAIALSEAAKDVKDDQ